MGARRKGHAGFRVPKNVGIQDVQSAIRVAAAAQIVRMVSMAQSVLTYATIVWGSIVIQTRGCAIGVAWLDGQVPIAPHHALLSVLRTWFARRAYILAPSFFRLNLSILVPIHVNAHRDMLKA